MLDPPKDYAYLNGLEVRLRHYSKIAADQTMMGIGAEDLRRRAFVVECGSAESDNDMITNRRNQDESIEPHTVWVIHLFGGWSKSNGF